MSPFVWEATVRKFRSYYELLRLDRSTEDFGFDIDYDLGQRIYDLNLNTYEVTNNSSLELTNAVYSSLHFTV